MILANGWMTGTEFCWRCEADTKWRKRGDWLICTGCKISRDYLGPTE
jgi:hypothetical protein